ncbi:MAG: HAD-IA family hydrolase [Chitinophagaceae bacterium]|nr:HAD-IA family hydrolase [Chitinophagaceae bacterium]
MSDIQLVVFDIAGTTVSDKGDVARAFIDACKKHGYDVAVEEVNKVMGFRKKEAIKILLEKFDAEHEDLNELIEKIHEAFLQNMISFYENDTDLQPLPYAQETFSILKQKGIRIALNTGFTKAITDTILKKLNWDTNDIIDHVISSDEVPLGRPHPHMIRSIMDSLGIEEIKRVAKVGDTQVDIQEGRNSGCGLVVSVTTGAYSRVELEKYDPDFIIDSLKELPALIQ